VNVPPDVGRDHRAVLGLASSCKEVTGIDMKFQILSSLLIIIGIACDQILFFK
jgi:hypothetical protein